MRPRTAAARTEALVAEAVRRGGKVRGVDLAALDAAPRTETPGMPKRVSKYRNKITSYNGVTYSSRSEAARARELDLLLAAGQIAGWARQVKFFLPDPDTTYTVDFLVFYLTFTRDGTTTAGCWAEDVKGQRLPKFIADCKRWRRYGPCPLRIITGGRVVEVVDGKPAAGAESNHTKGGDDE